MKENTNVSIHMMNPITGLLLKVMQLVSVTVTPACSIQVQPNQNPPSDAENQKQQ